MKNNGIEINNLTKGYRSGKDSKKAVADLSCSINRGEIFGLVGPNGAGKTTTLNLIVGLLKPDHGDISIFGKSNTAIEIKKKIGYLPENTVYPEYLNGIEFLEYMGSLYKKDTKNLKEKIYEISILVGISDYLKKRINTYSKGMIQRLFLAQAIIGEPELLILDEPTTGLDPLGIIEFRRIIEKLKEERTTIIICSHILTELEKLCNVVGFLKQGEIKQIVDLHALNRQKTLEDLFLEHFKEY